MFNIEVNNAQVSNDYNTNFPIPKGTFQVIITKADFDIGVTKEGKNAGMNRTGAHFEYSVFGAKDDGSDRKYTDWVLIDHESTNPNLKGMITANVNKITDLVLQVVSKHYQGNASSSPFSQGFNQETIGNLVDKMVYLTFDIDKKNENTITSYFPTEEPQSQQQYQQPTQQQPQQAQVNQSAGNAWQQNQPAQTSQNAGVQNQTASHSNNGNGQVLPHQQGGNFPAFAQPQQVQGQN